jgi:long-chain acyl-CoA synthetase
MNIVDIIVKENACRLDNAAIAEPGRQVAYAELLEAAQSTSQVLANSGVTRHDRVALFAEDGIDYVILSLAVLKLHAVIVPVSPSYSFNDIGSVMELIDIAWLISAVAVPGYEDHTSLSCRGLSNTEILIHSRKTQTEPPPEYFECNPAFVRFSSGTTGASKGVVISHDAIVERTDAADKALRITQDDTVLWLLSMSFHFVVTVLLFLRRGAMINICSKDFPGDLLSSLKHSRGTFMYASPFHYKFMSESPDFDGELLSDVRMAVSTAISLSDDIAKSFQSKFRLDLCQAYGIIEVGLPFIETSAEGHRDRSVGRIGPDYEIRFLDDGEILLRGRGMFSAYFSPWQTRESIDSHGWFHTGDIGRLDESGFLFIEGRKKEVINFAGMKIFPADVEHVLNQHESIEESRVYATPDDTFGQLPAAIVVLSAGEFDEKAVRRFCYEWLPSYMVPKSFAVVEKIEKTHSGKIKRQ